MLDAYWRVLDMWEDGRSSHWHVVALMEAFLLWYIRLSDKEANGGVCCLIRCSEERVFSLVESGHMWNKKASLWLARGHFDNDNFSRFGRSDDNLSNGNPHSYQNS